MTIPISSLANMEYALYGGLGLNAAAPNYLNGYCADLNQYNFYNPYSPQYQNYYGNWNNTFPQANPYATGVVANNTTPDANNQTVSSEQVKSDVNTLAKFYQENLEGKETLAGAAAGGLQFALMESPQSMMHFINAYKAVNPTDKIFKDIMASCPEAKKLWSTDPKLMQSAYSQLFRTNRNAQSKWFWQKLFVEPMKEADRSALEKIMKDALASGDKTKILEATEKLRAANQLNGRLPRALNSVKKLFGHGKAKLPTAVESMNEAVASGAVGKAVAEQSTTLLARGLKEGKGWFLFEMIFNLGKIYSAFKDGGFSSGVKQIFQSGLKSAGTAAGWVAGKAVGTAVGAKLGAMIGTAVCPGLGTAIGTVVGFIGGSVGMWLAGKATKAIAGVDESTRLETEKMKNTQEGQTQLLQFATQKYQTGELNKESTDALKRIYSQCA